MNKIYTFGDGFATGHIWPEWPQILQAMLPNYCVINSSAIGAGAEWLVHRLVNCLPDLRDNLVIFQWPYANRFDKLIEDDYWKKIADSDPVYDFNQHTINNEIWWLSSASTQPIIQQYHSQFVQSKQHQIRINNYKLLVKNALENIDCKYISTSTQHQETFSKKLEYTNTRQSEVQPSPIVHFDWVLSCILPQCSINFNQTRVDILGELIKSQNWRPYDHDREQHWADIVNTLNTQPV